MAPALLWIVKTAESSSLSHSENEERLQVFSQAQRTTRPRKAVASKKKNRRPEWHRMCSQESYSSNESVSSYEVGDLLSPFFYGLDLEPPTLAAQSTCRCVREASSARETHTIGTSCQKCWQGKQTVYRDGYGHRIDPCSPIATQDSAFVWHVIDYFTRMVLPSQNLYDELFNVDSIYGRFALQPIFEENFHHAGLAALYSTACQVKDDHDKTTATEVIKYIVKAVSTQRARLQQLGGKADELAVRTALSLALLSEAAEDMESFTIHRNSIEPLMDAAGGLQSIGSNSYARKALCQWDLFWAFGSGSNYALSDEFSVTDMPQYCPSYPFTTEVDSIVGRLPLGFQKLAEQQLVTFDTLELLSKIVDIDMTKRLKADGILSFDRVTPLRSTTRQHRCYWDASQCLNRLSTGADDVLNIESLVVLTMILYCCHAFLPQRVPILIYRAARRRLSNDFSQALRAHRETYPNLMLWSLMTVVDAWQKVDDQEPGQRASLLLPDLRDLTSSFRSDAELQALLRMFMWDEAFGVRSTRYWNWCRSEK